MTAISRWMISRKPVHHFASLSSWHVRLSCGSSISSSNLLSTADGNSVSCRRHIATCAQDVPSIQQRPICTTPRRKYTTSKASGQGQYHLISSSISSHRLDCSIQCCPPLQQSLQLSSQTNQLQFQCFSTLPDSDSSDEDGSDNESSNTAINNPHSNHPDYERLSTLRNVGIFAHVDAGKTTVTERMLALSGLVREAGSVDDGDTVTDYLPAERERGITIQSAAVGFDWLVPPASSANDTRNNAQPTRVAINLIDTPGHVDFSVEVHRSVSVLDGAVLVLDAVSGVQAQTETVWRAIRNTEESNQSAAARYGSHAHEPLPAVMFINKMDREGADFNHAMNTVRRKLRGSNPVPIQLPLYRVSNHNGGKSASLDEGIVAGTFHESPPHGEFVGMIDLLHMRAIVYPSDAESLSVEEAAPTVISLLQGGVELSSIKEAALDARRELISNLADADEIMEDLYLHAAMEEGESESSCPITDNISTYDIQSSLRRMTLERKVMPTLCGAALRGVGVEPVLDCVAEYCKFK